MAARNVRNAPGLDRVALDAMARTVIHIRSMGAAVSVGAARSFDELFDLACRKVDEFAPVNVSKAAHERATEMGLDDLRTYCWHCGIMGTHRKVFLWEHYKPVVDIKTAVLKLGPSPQLDAVSSILGSTRIAWVLQSEGKALGNTSRPDPAATYRKKGVELFHLWEDCGPINCARHRRRRS
jgi:hypothetical protein